MGPSDDKESTIQAVVAIPLLSEPTAPDNQINTTEDKSGDDAVSRRIRIMTIVKSTLTSMLSLAIAIWHGKVYITFQNTKAVAGAWPPIPDLVPTLLLFSVALAAFVFDVCMLLAYTLPGKKLGKLVIMVGNGAHYVVTSAKTVSFAISTVTSKTSFDFENATNQNADLWSWTCTDQAASMDSLTQAESNCTTQMISWYFALAQVAIEALGWIINFFLWLQQRKEENASPQDPNEKFQSDSQGVDQQLSDLTPKFDTSGLGV